MARITRRARIGAGIALATTAVLALTSCASATDAPASSSEGVDAAAATSVEDFGTFADLEAAAKEEGSLNVIALPRDWANYGEILDLFAEKDPEITINEASRDVSSAEEIQAADRYYVL